MSTFFFIAEGGHPHKPPPNNPQGGGAIPPISPISPPPPPPPVPPPCPAITVTPSSLPNGTVGSAYSVQFVATGSSRNAYIFTASGFLPGGLTLSQQGLLSGTPTAAGTGRISVTATDPNRCFSTVTDTIQIAPTPVPTCPSIFVTPTTLLSGETTVSYSQQLAATGGQTPYTFTATAMPAGLTISSAGLISGTPTVVGATTFTVTATDANSCTGTLASSIVVTAAVSPPGPQTGLKLLQSTGLSYLGAFRLPRGAMGTDADSFAFGGGAATFNSANGSLIIAGMVPANGNQQGFAEVSVPTPVIASSVGSLPYATLLSGASLLNPIGSKISLVDEAGGSQNYIGGFALVGGNLIVSVYVYYDGSGAATLSHFICNGTPPYAYVSGPWQVGTKGAGWVAGPMCQVPSGITVGGPWLTGQCALAIISRTSSGPSMSSFDPTQLGSTIPDPATLLVGYDLNTHETLGSWSGNPAPSGPTLFNGATTYPGAVIVGRTLLFGGRLGTGTFCYGMGQNNPALQGQPGAPDSAFPNWCYDPTAGPSTNPSGPGAFDTNYANELVAYDLNDLASVYAGSKSYWQVVPYANWGLTFPLGPTLLGITTLAADPSTGRLFVFQKFGDTYTPLVHVYAYTLT